MAMSGLILFTPTSMMALKVAHVDSKYRAIYGSLAKLCVSNKIGHSLKIDRLNELSWGYHDFVTISTILELISVTANIESGD